MVVTSENVSVKSTLKGLQLQCVEGKQYTRRTECIAKNQRQLCSLATKCPEICHICTEVMITFLNTHTPLGGALT